MGSTDLERRLVRVFLVSIRPFFIHSRTITLLQATSTSASTLFLGKRWPLSLNLLKPSTHSSSMNPRSTRPSPLPIPLRQASSFHLHRSRHQCLRTIPNSSSQGEEVEADRRRQVKNICFLVVSHQPPNVQCPRMTHGQCPVCPTSMTEWWAHHFRGHCRQQPRHCSLLSGKKSRMITRPAATHYA